MVGSLAASSPLRIDWSDVSPPSPARRSSPPAAAPPASPAGTVPSPPIVAGAAPPPPPARAPRPPPPGAPPRLAGRHRPLAADRGRRGAARDGATRGQCGLGAKRQRDFLAEEVENVGRLLVQAEITEEAVSHESSCQEQREESGQHVAQSSQNPYPACQISNASPAPRW